MFTIGHYRKLKEDAKDRRDVEQFTTDVRAQLQIRDLCVLATYSGLFDGDIETFLKTVTQRIPRIAVQKMLYDAIDEHVNPILTKMREYEPMDAEEFESGVRAMVAKGRPFALPYKIGGHEFMILPQTETTLKPSMSYDRYELVRTHIDRIDGQMYTKDGAAELIDALSYEHFEELYFAIAAVDRRMSEVDWGTMLKN